MFWYLISKSYYVANSIIIYPNFCIKGLFYQFVELHNTNAIVHYIYLEVSLVEQQSFLNLIISLYVSFTILRLISYRVLSEGMVCHKLRILPETAEVRPFCLAAVLRGVNLNKARYDSLIDLQEKLHHNICRERLVMF